MKDSSCKNGIMSLYCQDVQKLEGKFNGIELKHITRRLNEVVDSLAIMAPRREAILSGIFADNQSKPFIQPPDLDGANRDSHDIGLQVEPAASPTRNGSKAANAGLRA